MNYEEEIQKCKKDPYGYICNYVELLYPNTGKKVFEILALMPVSLIIPDLTFMSKKIRTNINALFLAPSGSGKTSLSDLFAKLTINPIKVESITPAKLETEIAQYPVFSLIVGDFARMSREQAVVKILEGILGEEKRVSRKTMRKDLEVETEAIGLLCGVASDLHFYILGGLIFRTCPILIGHNTEEHSEIGEHIKNQIAIENGSDLIDKEQIIKDYYLELAKIQAEKHETINKVNSYSILKKFREESYKEWDELTKRIVKEIGFTFYREYQEFFRFLCSHAFLNIFNRKNENGILYPNEEDFKIALNLMKRTIIFKWRLMRTEQMAKGISNIKEFTKIIQSEKVNEETKMILRNLVKLKKDGRIMVR